MSEYRTIDDITEQYLRDHPDERFLRHFFNKGER